MSVRYPYLQDIDFLMKVVQQPNVEQLIKITVLNFNEKPIQSIEGRVTSGSINLDGNSAIRRTANLSVFIEEETAEYAQIGGIFSLNKKIKVEVGISNQTDEYTDYPILWFPQGTFVIMGVNISHSTSGTSVSLQLKDKMVFLNGECGGVIPAATVFHEYEILDSETGEYVISKPTILQIIRELVNHFGNEQLGKILINDIDSRAKRVMKWSQPNALYLFINGEGNYEYSTNPPSIEGATVFETGKDIGFIYTDFYYPGELIADAGSTVCDILDSIKNTLGNYEYFYDLDGNFVFQEIKNYLNTNKATVDLNSMNQQDYVVDKGKGNSLYVFNNSNIVTSYSNAPQYSMIKNDFIVWGAKKTLGNNKIPIRYHLAIDEKPRIGNSYSVCIHKKWDEATKSYTEVYKLPIVYQQGEKFPQVGEIDRYYQYEGKVYYWAPSKGISSHSGGALPSGEHYYHSTDDNDNITVSSITTSDWRTELFLQGTLSTRYGTDSNYYYTELANEWPKLYDMANGKFKTEIQNDLTKMDYFLDFIDSNAAISEFSISNIGRRTKVLNDDSINCIFESDIPDVVLIKIGSEDLDSQRFECDAKGQTWAQIPADVYDGLMQGGSQNSAYNAVRDLLYQYTQYNETITVQILPMYALQPNIRITVEDSASGIHGDYIVNRISVPLDITGTMSLSCSRALTRI